MHSHIVVPRMFTDADGESRFDSCEIPMELHDHAPPAAPIFTAATATAAEYVFVRLPAEWYGEPHPTPYECLVVCLSGSFKFIGSAGDELIMEPGDRVLDLNTTGKGHATKVVSHCPAEGLIVRFSAR